MLQLVIGVLIIHGLDMSNWWLFALFAGWLVEALLRGQARTAYNSAWTKCFERVANNQNRLMKAIFSTSDVVIKKIKDHDQKG